MSGDCKIVTVEHQLTAVVKLETPMSGIPDAQRSSRKKIADALPALNVGIVGRDVTLFRIPGAGRLYMEPGVLVTRAFAPAGDVVPSELPAGRAAHFLMLGSYAGLPGAWQTPFGWCKQQNLALAGTNWEIYGEEAADPARQQAALYTLLA